MKTAPGRRIALMAMGLGMAAGAAGLAALHDGAANAARATRRLPATAAAPFLAIAEDSRVQLVTLAARDAIPAIYFDRLFAQAGGLTSYGANISDVMRLSMANS
jgi:hypothetical protein